MPVTLLIDDDDEEAAKAMRAVLQAAGHHVAAIVSGRDERHALAKRLRHEIKNPLAAVVVNVDYVRAALQEPRPPLDEIDRALDDVATAADRVRQAVDDLDVPDSSIPPPRPLTSSRPPGLVRERRGTVLVVDDEIAIGKAVARILKRDHDVTVETDARAALALLRTRAFDVVFCDLMMPDLNGMDFFVALEAESPAQAERVVFLTGGAFAPKAEQFLRTTKNRCLAKPFTREMVLGVVDELVP
jgi:CheY-like chemotaxis protein